MTSQLKVSHAEVFSTTWQFADRDELSRWLFDYYKKRWDPVLAQNAIRCLAAKPPRKALYVEEKLLLIRLDRAGRR